MNAQSVRGSDIIGHHGRLDKELTVKVYDFKRPDKFSREQIRVFQIIHESLARLATAHLSATLGVDAFLHVSCVDQMTYEECLRDVPDPGMMAVIAMDSRHANILLEIDPRIAECLLNRSLGGSAQGSSPWTDITPLGNEALIPLVTRLGQDLGEAWSAITRWNPRVAALETRPRFVQIVPPTEMCVTVRLQIKLGPLEGAMNLCVPYLVLHPHIHLLSARHYYSKILTEHAEPTPRRPDARSVPVDVAVAYRAQPLSLRELGRLHRGVLVPLPEYGAGEAELWAGGTTVARLRRSDSRGGSVFRCRAPSPFAEPEERWLREILGHGARASGPAAPGPDEALAASIGELSRSVGEMTSRLEKRFDELGSRQDALADHLALRMPSAPPPPGERAGPASARPFSFVVPGQVDALHGLLAGEHPQATALVLSYLSPGVSAQILPRFGADRQVDVARRIVDMGYVRPEVLGAVEQALRKSLDTADLDEALRGGGMDVAAEMLGATSRSVEVHVLEQLQRTDPKLAEELKRRMFVFEDTALLDRFALAAVVEAAGRQDVAMALKGASPEVHTALMDRLERTAWEEIERLGRELGRVRLSDVEAAQQRIVSMVRTLEEEGVITVARQEDTVE